MTPYLRSANVGNGHLALDDVKQMDFTPEERQRFRLQRGDVLVSEGSASHHAVGMASAWNEELRGDVCFQNTLLRYRSVPGVSDIGFALQWCRWAFESGAFRDAASGTNILHIGSTRARAMQVLLPPLRTQRRIVDVMAAVDEHVRSLTTEVENLAGVRAVHLASTYREFSETTPAIRLGDVLTEVKRPVVVEPSALYKQIGIRSHGRGVFTKEPVTGEGLGSKKVYWVEPGDLVINIVFAWEGAVAIVPTGVHGHCASHRFPTYQRADGGDVDFFRYYFSTQDGLSLLGDCSPGGAGRNRTLNRTRLLDSPVYLPEPAIQLRVIAEFRALEAALTALKGELNRLRSFRSVLLEALLNRDIEIPESYDALLEKVA
ncbi:restriction endonuclease subunit S [Kribbella sp. NPDC004536]|uniref:restriction endonuclease subunit S n=1 Tax=Kribbella sp. NPDC004536 TaxID=3364106 RepID=UPI0036C252E7